MGTDTSTSSAHTPGPWRIQGKFVGIETWPICELACSLPEVQVEANARLIAAAPELLSACEWMLRYWQGFENDEKPIALVSDMQQAVAKAEGRA